MRIIRPCAACAAILLASPALALDPGAGAGALRGAVEVDAAADWQRLAALDLGAWSANDPDDALDIMLREENGNGTDGSEDVAPRSSVRRAAPAPTRPTPMRPVRSADPATVSANLMGPARAPDYVPVVPDPSPSLAVLPRGGWDRAIEPAGRRASVSLLGAS